MVRMKPMELPLTPHLGIQLRQSPLARVTPAQLRQPSCDFPWDARFPDRNGGAGTRIGVNFPQVYSS